MEEYSGSNKLVPLGQTPTEDSFDDEIKLYIPTKRARNTKLGSFCFRICRFILMVAVFLFIYYCLYQLYLKNAKKEQDIPASATASETIEEETESAASVRMPLLINESASEINMEEFFAAPCEFRLPSGEGVKILMVNSHSSESVSESLTVADLAADLTKILQSRGIGAYFDDASNDADGTIGAYSRMRDNVVRLKDIHNEAFLVVDIHNSDSGMPLTFTVGSGEGFAWQENLRFACGIYNLMKVNDSAFRILPSSLGQDNGLLTVSVGIGGNGTEDAEAREILSALADALTELLKNEPLR